MSTIMETCASYTSNIRANNSTQYQATASMFAVSSTTENLDTILTSHILKYTPTTHKYNNNNNNNDYNRTEMDIEGSNLDLISNWKTVSNEEENEMAISVYIAIHVVLGLIGVFFNGW